MHCIWTSEQRLCSWQHVLEPDFSNPKRRGRRSPNDWIALACLRYVLGNLGVHGMTASRGQSLKETFSKTFCLCGGSPSARAFGRLNGPVSCCLTQKWSTSTACVWPSFFDSYSLSTTITSLLSFTPSPFTCPATSPRIEREGRSERSSNARFSVGSSG
jgi:hypothetical protein